MSFEWSSTGTGQIIKSLHLTELHDNIDSIKDNEACIADKTSDNNSYNNGVDSSYNSSVDSPHRSGVDSGYKYGVDSSYRSSVHSEANSSYDSTDNVTDKGSYESVVQDAFYGTFKDLDWTNHVSAAQTANELSYNTSVCNGY